MTRYLLSLTLSVSIAIAILALFSPPSHADIPQMISYQGKVNDSGGTPVADDAYTMRFRIYDDAGAGNLEWDSGDQSVQVTGGVFNVMLGESPQPVIDLEFDEDYWLLVTIETDDQLPRVRVASAGYAYMASGLVPGTEVSGSVNSGTNAAIKGVNTATAGTTYGVWGESASTSSQAVYGEASATTGTTYGFFGQSASTSGRAVYGQATATTGITYGGRFVSYSTSGRAVYGRASATTGITYGGRFVNSSASGRAVYGYASATSGTNYGVYGKTDSPSGYAGYFEGDAKVTGDLTVDGAFTAPGMGDITAVNAGTGLDGGGTSGDVTLDVEVPLCLTGFSADGGIIEGYNASTSGRGVYGEASATWGNAYGGRFESASTSGRGVYGEASATSGVNYGVFGSSASTDGRGVCGDATATTGFFAYGGQFGSASTDGRGVYGWAYSGTGTTYGVYGMSHSAAGYGVYYSGGLAGTGTKACVVKTSQGPTLMYCQESPENWFEDFGEGQLVNGRCHIELDPLFLETVTIDDANRMKVFVEHRGRCKGTYVETGLTGFDVVEQDDGMSSVEFCYRVVAKRKGFESKRLDYCKAAETDSFLYPELREKELRELENEKARMEKERHGMEEERAQQRP